MGIRKRKIQADYLEVNGSNLRNGHTKSCGCLRINTINAHRNTFKKSFKDFEKRLKKIGAI